MTLRVLILTTETTHHLHFTRALVERGYDVSVICETEEPTRPHLPLTNLQAEFERDLWFPDGAPSLFDLARTQIVARIRPDEVSNADARWDAAVSFGTGILREGVLRNLPTHRWNLHGGDPQRYRGLDSHLWAIYHRDTSALVTTLHRLDVGVDSGPIVAGSGLDVSQAPDLFMLRSVNTEAAIALVDGALATLDRTGVSPLMPQVLCGRYYSALPLELLGVVTRNYAEMVAAV